MQDDQIYGLTTDAERCDELMFLHIRKDWREHEGALYTTKWFDYRFMHPVQAAYLYAHEFVKAYRRAYRINIDRNAAEHIKPLKHEDVFACDKMTISGIWRGRQCADAIGCPYDVYLDLAMTARLGYWKQRQLPRPTQLYSDLVTDAVQAKWEDRQTGITYIGQHQEFRLHRYVGSQAQNDHHEWLLDLVTKQGSSLRLLSRFVQDDLLPLEKIALRFGDDVAKRALQAA